MRTDTLIQFAKGIGLLYKAAAMYMRCLTVCLLAVVLGGAGCKKAQPTASAPPAQPASGQLLARIHWLGKKELASQTNAASFLGLWNLPESMALEAQTLDKLSTAPWRLLLDQTETNAPSALLRPLLDDLVRQECYLELRQASNQPAQLVAAVRVGKERAGLWQKNLAAVIESLTGVKTEPSTNGWTLRKHHLPDRLEFKVSEEWVIVSLNHDDNSLLQNVVSRLRASPKPFASATNYWLELEADIPRSLEAISQRWKIEGGSWPRLSLALIGDGDNVRTSGALGFPGPVWEPAGGEWRIPTNLVSDPLVSFTVLRGGSKWLEGRRLWQNAHLGEAPGQWFLWSVEGIPYQTYFCGLVSDATNLVSKLQALLMEKVDPWIQSNAMGHLKLMTNSPGVTWVGIPFMAPFVKTIAIGDAQYLCGGCFPFPVTNHAAPPELFAAITGTTNLVYYDWELTGPRIGGWFDVGQLLRIALKRPQVPSDSLGVKWLAAIAPKLGNCTTEVTRQDGREFYLRRKSSVGFNAAELHLLVDWLESPSMPFGLHTGASTNAVRQSSAPGVAPKSSPK